MLCISHALLAQPFLLHVRMQLRISSLNCPFSEHPEPFKCSFIAACVAMTTTSSGRALSMPSAWYFSFHSACMKASQGPIMPGCDKLSRCMTGGAGRTFATLPNTPLHWAPDKLMASEERCSPPCMGQWFQNFSEAASTEISLNFLCLQLAGWQAMCGKRLYF